MDSIRPPPFASPAVLSLGCDDVEEIPGIIQDIDDVDDLPGRMAGAGISNAWSSKPPRSLRENTTAITTTTTSTKILSGHDTEVIGALRELQSLHEERFSRLLEAHEKRLMEKLDGRAPGSPLLRGVSARKIQPPINAPGVPMAPAKELIKAKRPKLAGLQDEPSATDDEDLTPKSNVSGRSGKSNQTQETQKTPLHGIVPVEIKKNSSSGKDMKKVKHSISQKARLSVMPKQEWLHGMLDDDWAGTFFTAEKGVIRKAASYLSASRAFEYSISLLIVFNAFVIGWQVSWNMNNLREELPGYFRDFDVMFTISFTIELTIRLIADGPYYFKRTNENLGWNYLDVTLVGSALLEELLNFLSFAGPKNFMAVRLIRLMRLVRVVKALRVMRFFRDLRILVAGIMSSLHSLFYALVLLLLIMYIVGVMIMQIVSEHLASGEPGNLQIAVDEVVLVAFFNSPSRAILTLFKCIMGGIDWGDVAEPLIVISQYLGAFFALYVAFGTLCVLNIITGVFVENAMQITAKDEETLVMAEYRNRTQRVEDVKKLFKTAMGKSGEMEMTLELFEERFADAKVQAYFKKCGVDVSADSAAGIFNLFDYNNDGSVSVTEFAAGVQQIHGMARAIDIVRLRHESKVIQSQMQAVLDVLGVELSYQERPPCRASRET